MKHYRRWKRYGDPLATIYNMDGPLPPCSIENCSAPVTTSGIRRVPERSHLGPLCAKHYQRARRGDPLTPRRERGQGTLIAGYAYISSPGHPNARKHSDYVAVHRLIMEQVLGRYLLPEENVHHRNGVRDDNRPENLELWSSSQPSGQRAVDKLAWARGIVALYEADENKL